MTCGDYDFVYDFAYKETVGNLGLDENNTRWGKVRLAEGVVSRLKIKANCSHKIGESTYS